MPKTSRRFAVIAGLILFATAAVMGVQVSLIPAPVLVDALGPRLMPAVICGALLLLAMGYTQAAWQARCPDVANEESEAPEPGYWARSAWVLGGLAVLLLCLKTVGVGLAGGLSFVLFARAFASRRPMRDAVIGGLFTLMIWLLFDRLLGVQLGPFVQIGGLG